jgi:hypothetical protein
MMHFYAGGLLIVGVTRGNVDRLTAGQPMKFDVVRPVQTVVVVFGENKPAILEELKKGPFEIPKIIFEEAEKDPT